MKLIADFVAKKLGWIVLGFIIGMVVAHTTVSCERVEETR